MIVRIAIRNLLHDRFRAATALAGVAFAVLLAVLQIGILEGANRDSSGVIDHASADVWVMSRNTATFDFALPMPERRFFSVLATPGVERAERVVLALGQWRTSDGRQRNVLVVGIEPDAELAGPWGPIDGRLARIREPGGVVIDGRERERFGPEGRSLEAGDALEINGRRATVVAFTREVGSFTTLPYVFTSLDNARAFAGEPGSDDVTYVLVRARPGLSPEELARRLGELPEVDAATPGEFRDRTRAHWIHGTGLGQGIVFTAALGLVVGLVVVGQTIYTMTVERRREFGTLKAIGCSGASLAGIVLVQSAALGLAGYAVGLAGAVALRHAVAIQGISIVVTERIAAAAFVVTIALCAAAAGSSILRLVRLEPALVFQS